jgi:hypothetical protein
VTRPSLLVASLAWLVSAAAVTAGAAPVRVRIVDDGSGQPTAARAYLWRGDESLLPAGFPAYDKEDERHFLVPGEFTLDLPPGAYHLRVERGTEFLPVDVAIESPRTDVVGVRLRRWIDMNRAGWYSADMHVHRDPADLPLILKAEDLNFAPTITTHVWSTEISKPWNPRPEFVTVVEPGRFYTSNAARAP